MIIKLFFLSIILHFIKEISTEMQIGEIQPVVLMSYKLLSAGRTPRSPSLLTVGSKKSL